MQIDLPPGNTICEETTLADIIWTIYEMYVVLLSGRPAVRICLRPAVNMHFFNFLDSDGFFWQKENYTLLNCLPKARTLGYAIFMTNYSKAFKIKAI